MNNGIHFNYLTAKNNSTIQNKCDPSFPRNMHHNNLITQCCQIFHSCTFKSATAPIMDANIQWYY